MSFHDELLLALGPSVDDISSDTTAFLAIDEIRSVQARAKLDAAGHGDTRSWARTLSRPSLVIAGTFSCRELIKRAKDQLSAFVKSRD